MAKKKVTDQSWGPYWDTYLKTDHEGVQWEQEVPAYREVATPHGTFGVPAGHKMTFENGVDKDGEPVTVAVHTEVKSAKPRKSKKVVPDKPATKAADEE